MKFCIKCGTKLDDNDNFCTKCGSKAPQLQSQEETFNSSNDNETNHANSEFNPQNLQSNPKQPFSIKNTPKTIIAIIAILLIFLTIILLIFGIKEKQYSQALKLIDEKMSNWKSKQKKSQNNGRI